MAELPAPPLTSRLVTRDQVLSSLGGGNRDVIVGPPGDAFLIDFQSDTRSYLVEADTNVDRLVRRLVESAYFPQPGRPYEAVVHGASATADTAPLGSRRILARACQRLGIVYRLV